MTEEHIMLYKEYCKRLKDTSIKLNDNLDNKIIIPK